MGSARHTGHVGGLAIALGVGAAILNGAGIADAHTQTEPPSSPELEQIAVHRTLGGAVAKVLAELHGPPTSRDAGKPASASLITGGVIHGCVPAAGSTGRALTYTVLGTPSDGSDVVLDSSTGEYAYLPNATLLQSRGTGTFNVMAMETPSWAADLEQLPWIGSEVQPALVALHQTPLLGDLLTPVIGAAAVVPVDVDISKVVPDAATPVVRTITMTSYDGTNVDVHFLPAAGADPDTKAPTVILGPGLGYEGQADQPWALFGAVGDLRDAGYNVLTWDPRGEFGWAGELYPDDPEGGGKDLSAMIDLIAKQPEAQLDRAGDPRVGRAMPTP